MSHACEKSSYCCELWKTMFTNSICSSHKWHDTKWKLKWIAVTIVTVHAWSFPRIHTVLSFFLASHVGIKLSQSELNHINQIITKYCPEHFSQKSQVKFYKGSWSSALNTTILLYPRVQIINDSSLFLVQNHTLNHCRKCFDDIKHGTVITQKYQMTFTLLMKTHLSILSQLHQ